MNADATPKRLTVLYIEDNESNLLLVKRIFRDRHDIELQTASRGQEGLTMARDVTPGLILLDLHLPDMPGAEVLSALREDPATASIPVVAVSADATGDQIAHLRALGVVDYVTKPFEVPRLLGVVDSFLPAESRPDPTGSDDTDAAPASDDAVLDPSRVAELLGLDPNGETFRSLCHAALQEATDQIAAISAALRNGRDARAVSAAAHSLLSSAAIVGARHLGALAGEVEQAARAGSMPDASVVSRLESALAETRRATVDADGGR
jgi:CheY-like chemotaxis protein